MVKHQVLDLSRGFTRLRCLRVDAFKQCFLLAGQRRQAAPQRQHVFHFGATFEFINGSMVCGAHQGHAGPCRRNHDDIARLQRSVFAFVALGNKFVQV